MMEKQTGEMKGQSMNSCKQLQWESSSGRAPNQRQPNKRGQGGSLGKNHPTSVLYVMESYIINRWK